MNIAAAYESPLESFNGFASFGAARDETPRFQAARSDREGVIAELPTVEHAPQFHFLFEHAFDELKPLAERILQQQSEIFRQWRTQLAGNPGDSSSAHQNEFARTFEGSLTRAQSALLVCDIARYASELTRLGESLAEQHVSFGQVIGALHHFERSVQISLAIEKVLPHAMFKALDDINRVQRTLIASGYFRRDGASASFASEHQAALLPAGTSFHGLVGGCPKMRRLFQSIEAAGAARANLLIIGESGTGKELVARAIHSCGPRADAPFIALNCAALPKDLIESELFGYKRGAFSGANSDHLGLFRAAEGGTLFLDEITEMSAETQSKLLRAIQERSIRPVGSTREQPVNVRVIASTNRDPKAAVAQGQLRADLYYRLQAVVLTVPPLRERIDEVPLLVDHFINLFNQNDGRRLEGIEQHALNALLNYNWPGNVRELSNVIEAAFTFGKGPLIECADLPPEVVASDKTEAKTKVATAQVTELSTFADNERELISRALINANGNKVLAAKRLQISRKKLYAKIAKYQIAEVA
jgi:transcriptional regulator with PAS, ATPase and Fis domain